MKRRQFLSLWALPSVLALPALPVAARSVQPEVAEEVFGLFDWHHQCAISWRMSDGTRIGVRGHRIGCARPLPYVTEEEKEMLRDGCRAQLRCRTR